MIARPVCCIFSATEMHYTPRGLMYRFRSNQGRVNFAFASEDGQMQTRTSLCRVCTASLLLAGAAPVMAAQVRFDNGGGDNLWENPLNWDTAGVDGIPTTADIADIGSLFTANLSSAQTVLEVQVQWPNSSSTYLPGTATLNIQPGANLQVTSTNGVRIGRQVQTGQTAGSSTGVVNQTGGLFQVNSGTNGIRLSQADSGTVADSLYVLSGGSVRGGATNGSMTAPLQIGNINNTFTRAEFRMVGTGPTEARFEDVRMQGGAGGQAVLKFVLDANGVTPIVAEDELRFSGTNNTNLLEIELSALAPEADITLITADRLTTNSSAPSETFTGLADGAPISAIFGLTQYNWLVRYQDGSDDGVLDAFVKLEFVSTTDVPEPAALSLLGIGAAALVRRRRI